MPRFGEILSAWRRRTSRRNRTDVHHAETKAGAYERAVPERDWFDALLLSAVSAGLSGVAAGLAENLRGRLAKLAKHSDNARENQTLALGIADTIKEGLFGIAESVKEGVASTSGA